MAIKFIRINKEIWDSYTDSQKNLYKDSLVFVKDSENSTAGQLWSDGAYFGINNSTFTINEKYNDSFMESSESDSTTYNIIKNVNIDDIILWRGNDCEYKISNLLGDTYSNLDVKNIKLIHNHLYKVKSIKHNGETYQYLIHLNNYDYQLPVASNDTLGGIKTGYITNNSKYAVNVDENNNAYVEITSNEKIIKEFYSVGFVQINEGSVLLDITGTKIEDGEIAKYIGMVDDGKILEESIEWTNIIDIFPKTLILTRNNEYRINYVVIEDIQYIIIKPVNIDVVQSNWNQSDSNEPDFIKGKPTIGNGRLTLKAGNNEITFDANQSSSVNFEIKASDLGLNSVLKYIGITSSSLEDNKNTYPILLSDGTTHYPKSGHVVFYQDKEFIYNGSKWEEFGYPTTVDLNGYKTKQATVSDPIVNGSSDTFIDTISQNDNGEIAVTKKNI